MCYRYSPDSKQLRALSRHARNDSDDRLIAHNVIDPLDDPLPLLSPLLNKGLPPPFEQDNGDRSLTDQSGSPSDLS